MSPRSFQQQGDSPLDYGTYTKPKRAAIVDDTAPPAGPGDGYFTDRTRKVRKSPTTGRPYKVPKEEPVPGAAPGTVAFVDYSVRHRDETPEVYVHYMDTRPDQKNQGLAKHLITNLVEAHPGHDVDFGELMDPQAEKVRQHVAQTFTDRRVRGKYWG